jgi:uncharacterized RDD family membrane protein YckC
MVFPAHAPPAPVPPGQLSSWWRRVGAYVIDSALFTIPFTIWSLVQAFSELPATFVDPVTGEPNQRAATELMRAMLPGSLLFGSLLLAAYILVMHATLGQTLGKMAFGIKVVKEDGSRCDLRAAVKRGLIFPLAAAIPLFGGIIALVNGLSPHWDPQGRSIGDKQGGTYVIVK